ncbi:hypothetical protein [Nostoc sp.]|uniref:hypothetical protein n=1 Tax=Nostoc sp. TaxID=1180 RepID=UPI002FF6914B
MTAPAITDDQATVMSICTELLSKEESLSLKRHKLLERLGGLVEYLPYAAENEATLYKATRILGYLQRDDQELAALDSKESSNQFTMDRKLRLKEKELVSQFLININYWGSLERGEELREYYGEGKYGSYAPVAYWLTQNSAIIKECLGVTVPKDVYTKPMQVIQSILKALGLAAEQGKQRRVKFADTLKFNPISSRYQLPFSYEIEAKGANHSERVRPYYACKESHQRMFHILEAREAQYQSKKTVEAEALPF